MSVRLPGKPYASVVSGRRLIIEASGVAEPRNLREAFQDYEDAGVPIMKQIALKTMVTVVDASHFGELMESSDRATERPDLAGYSEVMSRRRIIDLLMEQVEVADVLVLNKLDQA
eukprot:scaffold297_cov386-Prasinococcus_capsulatus_cf.AAC.14